MSSSWTSPDAGPDKGRTLTGTAFGRPYAHVEPVAPPVRDDVRAGLLTVAVTVLAGAPVGLLWAALAPRVDVVVAGGAVNLVETYGDGFIAVDGYFLAAGVLAGLVGGLLACWLGSRHGPVVVVGLAVGGLAAAYVAMVVGEQVALESLRAAVGAGGQGGLLEVKALQVLAGWPVASLLTYLGVSLARGR